MSTPTRNTLFLLAFLALISLSVRLSAGTVTAAKVAAALDSPSGVTFGPCTNASVITSYSTENIGNSDETATGKVLPYSGSNFLQMNGSGDAIAKGRSGRVKSSFSLTVKGAGTLSFQQRVNTYGKSDDCLIVYEDDIDDELDPPGTRLGGDYWAKLVTEDGDRTYDVTVDDFFGEESVTLSTEKYNHTLTFALLAPDSSDIDNYNPPDSDTKKENEILYKAWLDAFVWEPDETVTFCDFSSESSTSFGANGITVYLNTDYVSSDSQPIFTFYYTLDGKTPTKSSSLYNAEEGILIQKSCRLRVAVYEGSALVSNDLYADYVLRDAPKVPTCTLEQGAPFSSTATASFAAISTAPSLEFHYTTDGSVPTLDSPSGGSCVLSEECTLKVRAYDDGSWSETASFPVKRAAAPVASIVSDDEASQSGVFIGEAVLTLSSNTKADIYYRLNGGEAQKYTDPLEFTTETPTEVEYLLQPQSSSGNTLHLESKSSTITFRKATQDEDNGAWITGLLPKNKTGWVLVPISRGLPPSMEIALAQWLKPYKYLSGTRQHVQTSRMESGNCYWVYLSNGAPKANKPETFYSADPDGASSESTSGVWRLVLKNALYYFQDGLFRKATETKNDLPGWAKD